MPSLIFLSQHAGKLEVLSPHKDLLKFLQTASPPNMTRMFSYWTRKNKMTTGRGINLNGSRKYLLITRFTKPMSEMRLTSTLMFTKQIIFRHATLRAYVFYCTRAFLKFQSFLVEFLYLLHRIHCDKLICKKQKNDTYTSKRTLKKQPQCTQHPPDAN